jgi:hypothetical protein
MEWWNRLDPMARRVLLIGVPLVALAALANAFRRPNDDPPAEEGEAVPGSGVTPATTGGGWIIGGQADVMNAGEFGSWLDELGEMVAGIPDRIKEAEEDDKPKTPVVNVPSTVTRSGETWKDLLRRSYPTNPTNMWVVVAQHPGNLALVSRYPKPDDRLPGNVKVYLPPRTW